MTSPPVNDIVRQAMSQIKAGNLNEARDLFQSICEKTPRDPWARTMLGTIYGELGRPEEAIACYRRATDIDPSFSQALFMLGNAFRVKGDLTGSLSYLKKAVTAAPRHVEAWVMMTWLNIQLGDLKNAESNARKALAIAANVPTTHFALANVLKAQGRWEEAISGYRRAIELGPRYTEAHMHLGSLLESHNRLADAAATFQDVTRFAPNNDVAHRKLAIVLHRLGRLEDAIAHYRNVLSLCPNDTRTMGNLSNAYLSLGALDNAEAGQRQALCLDPGVPEGHNNLGNVLKAKGKVSEAIACYRRAIELDPSFAGAHSNLLLCLNYLGDQSRQSILEEHKAWERAFAMERSARHDNRPDPERKLRIGYVSPDFRTHAVAYFVEPLLKNHDRTSFEVVCYAEVARSDRVTERMKGYAHLWRDTCGWNDAQLVNAIRADAIDILVDLAGHTGETRLRIFTAKPAPVQVSYIGYANTSGLSTIDYRLTDELTDPPQDHKYYTEKLVYLETGFSCYEPPRGAPQVSPSPSSRVGHVTFGSFSNRFKINDDVLDLWCKVLDANPASRMRIFRHMLRGSAREELYGKFIERGVARERVDIWNEIPKQYAQLPRGLMHLGLYDDIDISLDTFPWNGHTISCESLWMGVPVVTLFGDRHAGRIGASILNAVGLPCLVAGTRQKYVKIATNLANDMAQLEELRTTLRKRMQSSLLCDGKRFSSAVEKAYRNMWRQWCGQQLENN